MMHYWLFYFVSEVLLVFLPSSSSFSLHCISDTFIHTVSQSDTISTLCVIYSSSFLFILSFNFHNLIINITMTVFVHVHLFSLFLGVFICDSRQRWLSDSIA
jgi:hypothetical protein